jgi:DivIVA domain-containing protein
VLSETFRHTRTTTNELGEVMPLTPEDVSNKRFTPVRLREGYDMGEVDQFLDEVEAELARLTAENDDLRTKLSAAQSGSMPTGPIPVQGESQSAFAPEPPAAPEPEPEVEAPAQPVAPAQPAVAAVATPAETIRVETVPQASNAAARLLEIATRNADELVEEAKNEADKIVGEARTKAERLDHESKGRADRLEADARSRAQMLDTETAERRTQLFGDLEKERDKLEVEVENLRSFEREYRSRLKSYFTQQLESLSGNGDHEPAAEEVAAPKRLRSILDKEES